MPDRPGLVRGYRFKRAWRGPTRAAVLKEWNYTCALATWDCSAYGPNGKGLILAHLVAHDMGGADDDSNLVPLCRRHSGHIDGGRRYD